MAVRRAGGSNTDRPRTDQSQIKVQGSTGKRGTGQTKSERAYTGAGAGRTH